MYFASNHIFENSSAILVRCVGHLRALDHRVIIISRTGSNDVNAAMLGRFWSLGAAGAPGPSELRSGRCNGGFRRGVEAEQFLGRSSTRQADRESRRAPRPGDAD